MSSSSGILAVLESTCSHLGESFTHVSASRWRVEPYGRLLFAKLASPADQVLGEAASLNAMSQALKAAYEAEGSPTDGMESLESWTMIPTVHAFGQPQGSTGKAYLVTDYKDMSGRLGRKEQRLLGRKLALMHKHTLRQSSEKRFGFDRPTHCGITEQDNTYEDKWSTFFIERRIGKLIKQINDSSANKLDAELREKVWPLLFPPHLDEQIQPAIVHGDLWSGNAGVDAETSQPVIFDPSSFYAHGEYDLGIMHMFGGFTKECFDAYHEVLPRSEPHYEQRIVSAVPKWFGPLARSSCLAFARGMPLTILPPDLKRAYELTHHLNHWAMFGGSYASGAKGIMKSLISWAEGIGQKADL